MTTPTGTISINDVRNELGISGTTSLNDSDVRGLAGKSSGQISMNDLRGKTKTLLVAFSYNTISNTWTGNSGTSSGLQINTNKTITVAGSGGTTQTWLQSSGTASDYEVKCQYNYGDNLGDASLADTWFTLSEDRFFGVSSGGQTGGDKFGNFTITIRKRSATSDSVSDTVNFRVDQT